MKDGFGEITEEITDERKDYISYKMESKRLIFRYDRKNPRLLFSSRSTLTVHI